jgi:hypothetical protein
MLPEPHIPDIPEVSGIPEAADISDDMDVPDVAAVAGAMVPIVVPPPSKVAVDPNIPDGEVPTVEHVVPLPDTAVVPVTPVGSGLSPGDASSVAPRGMPVGDTVEPVPRPSGEVAPIVGVGAAIPPTCAMATLQTKSAGRTTAIDEIRIGIPSFEGRIDATSARVDRFHHDLARCEAPPNPSPGPKKLVSCGSLWIGPMDGR